MVPDGFSEMDRYALRLGKIEGLLERLIEEFTEEREQAHQERRMLFEKVGKLDLIEARLDQLEHKYDGLKSQVYSTKAELDKRKNEDNTQRSVAADRAKWFGLITAGLTAIGGAVWIAAGWISAHWNEVSAFLKSKL